MTIRVLHCPNSTGGNAWYLSRAERKLGLASDVMVFSPTWLRYDADIDLRMNERNAVGKAAAITAFLIRAARDYDVVHFNFGESLLSHLPGALSWLEQKDLPLLHALGKPLVVTYQGCDVRQKSQAEVFPGSCACGDADCGACTPDDDARKARRASIFDKYADAIFALNPDLLRVLPDRATFLPYTSVDPAEWTPSPAAGAGAPFTILHAPTSQDIKGTRYVFEAIEALKGSHPELDFLIVENLPHSEVRGLYERADLVIDQLLVGWYGGLAVEAMALGKPVVCYIREEDLVSIPELMRAELPVIRADKGTLLPILQRAMEDRSGLVGIGARSREYVEHWHDPLKVAAQTKATYERILANRKGGAPRT
jgi:glycosyltransferase involved in cell wall biosynthesis